MYGFYLLLASHTLDKVFNGISSCLMLIRLMLATCPKFVLVTHFIVIFALGLQKDSGDARASSFLKIIELIPQTSQPPLMLFVENVVGFEVCCRNLLYPSTGFFFIFNITNNIIFYHFLKNISYLLLVLQTSDTHSKMLDMLEQNHFTTQEFILSPLQFGVPYSRPRYFCLVIQIKCIIFFSNFSRFMLALGSGS